MEVVKQLAKSPAFWRILVGLLSVGGVTVSPEAAETIAQAGISVSLALEAVGAQVKKKGK